MQDHTCVIDARPLLQQTCIHNIQLHASLLASTPALLRTRPAYIAHNTISPSQAAFRYWCFHNTTASHHHSFTTPQLQMLG
jgi:hypothetical protein